jgi:uncharacterized protein YtpQ (UPF0354 family)
MGPTDFTPGLARMFHHAHPSIRPLSEQPPSGGSRGSCPPVPDHSAFRAEPGRIDGPRAGAGNLADAQPRLLPILKPRSYVDPGSPGRSSLANDWLPDVVICYALRSKDIFRFVTAADADRWQMDLQALHEVAIANLCRLSWPAKMGGARQPDGGRLIVIETGDGLASSRLLHPDLHRLLCGPLGSPFRAGIPDRDTLVVYSDRRRIRQQTERQLRKDHRTSSYPITPRPFLVTPDGIAPAPS